jgi:hypothetical protein
MIPCAFWALVSVAAPSPTLFPIQGNTVFEVFGISQKNSTGLLDLRTSIANAAAVPFSNVTASSMNATHVRLGILSPDLSHLQLVGHVLPAPLAYRNTTTKCPAGTLPPTVEQCRRVAAEEGYEFHYLNSFSFMGCAIRAANDTSGVVNRTVVFSALPLVPDPIQVQGCGAEMETCFCSHNSEHPPTPPPGPPRPESPPTPPPWPPALPFHDR